MSNNAYQPLTVKDKTILNKLGGRLIAATVFAVIVGRLSFLRAGPLNSPGMTWVMSWARVVPTASSTGMVLKGKL